MTEEIMVIMIILQRHDKSYNNSPGSNESSPNHGKNKANKSSRQRSTSQIPKRIPRHCTCTRYRSSGAAGESFSRIREKSDLYISRSPHICSAYVIVIGALKSRTCTPSLRRCASNNGAPHKNP